MDDTGAYTNKLMKVSEEEKLKEPFSRRWRGRKRKRLC